MENLNTEKNAKPSPSPEDTRKRNESFMERVLEEWGSKINNLDTRLVRERRETEVGNLKYLDALRTRGQEARLLFG